MERGFSKLSCTSIYIYVYIISIILKNFKRKTLLEKFGLLLKRYRSSRYFTSSSSTTKIHLCKESTNLANKDYHRI